MTHEEAPRRTNRGARDAAASGIDVPTVPRRTDAVGLLRQELEAAMSESGLYMKDLMVQDKASDPYRIDTPASHQSGRWFADAVRRLGYAGRTIHLRGLHYMLLGAAKPDGSAYANTTKDWNWLVGEASKAARFLGYVPFDTIVDQRNTPPTVREFEPPEPWAFLTVPLNVRLPRPDELKPALGVAEFEGVQPYRIVLAGEKSSLASVLGPIADAHGADLYLPTGYMSDSMVHRIAKTAAEDGRPLVLLYFADCDPDGWHMPIVVGRSLQAFKTMLFPELDFQVHRVGLTPDQVRAYDLPSTPIKDTNTRRDAWREATGVEQTEIDALASLRPELLARLATEAIDAFYDATLNHRVERAKVEWHRRATEAIQSQLDSERLGDVRHQAEDKLRQMQAEIDALADQLRLDIDDFDLPEFEVPEAQLGGGVLTPLLDSRWSWLEQTRRLIESKSYRTDGAP